MKTVYTAGSPLSFRALASTGQPVASACRHCLIACCRLLAGSLFNKKEPQQEGDEHPLEDTARRLLLKLQLFHTVARTGEQARPCMYAVFAPVWCLHLYPAAVLCDRFPIHFTAHLSGGVQAQLQV